jgi:hypothetical protein
VTKLEPSVEQLHRPRRRWLYAFLLVALLLGACNRDRDRDKAEEDETPDIRGKVAEYEKGSQLPSDWPQQAIPLPAGAQLVASIPGASVPGSQENSSTVLYSVTQSVQEVHDFMRTELPKRGWNLLESSDPAASGVSVTSAEGNGYIGVFTAGVGLAPPEVVESDKVSLQIILSKIPEAAAEEPSPEASPSPTRR